MKNYWKIGLAVLLLVSFVLISRGKDIPPPFIEMEVKGVSLDAIGQNPVVILSDKEGKKALPIWIGLLEANAIDKEVKNIASPRPMTHDLLHSILAQTQVKVKEVKIFALKEHTYYATLYLMLNKNLIEVDARPSDAIILSLKSKTPILVSTKILDEQGITLVKKSPSGERHGIRVQELTPSLASHFSFKGPKGVLVSETAEGSGSESSDIRPGDIITRINLKEVGSVQEFEEVFDTLKAGSSVQISLFRDEKIKEVTLSLKP